MKHQPLSKLAYLTFLCAIFGLSRAAYGAGITETTASQVSKQVAQNTQKTVDEKQRTILNEAAASLSETRSALNFLNRGKKKEALQAIEHATGKLELILAREPKLALAPAGVAVTTQDYIGDSSAIRSIRKEAQTALSEGRVQDARNLLRDLASETVIRVTNLPLASYPTALKSAARLIDENKVDQAKETLQVALNTLVLRDTVIPLPVAASQLYLEEAERLAQKSDRTVEENKTLNQLLSDIKRELKLAEEFGYGARSDFNELYVQLKDIETKTGGGKSPNGIFAKIKDSVGRLLSSLKNESDRKAPPAKSM